MKLNGLTFVFVVFSSFLRSQVTNSIGVEIFDYSKWTELNPGMEYIEMDAPVKSIIGDSKISILRIDTKKFHFDIHAATGYDSVSRDLHEWTDTFRLNVAFNASMYDLRTPLVSRGYLKSREHYNKGKLLEGFNSMIAIGPKDSTENNLQILDLTCSNWQSKKDDFHSYAQGLRMIDCSGKPMHWKKPQTCSMLIAAIDNKDWFYLIFTRSPYSHNQMIDFMTKMPYHLHSAIYLEGGPETSLLIDINGHCIEKVGSWITNAYERDDNNHFWNLPNVIGIRKQ